MQKTEQKPDFTIEINGISAPFKKPTFQIWRFAVAAMEKSGATAFKISMAKNCCLDKNTPLLTDEYINDVIKYITDLVEYNQAVISKEENCYVVTIDDFICRLKPVSIESRMLAERNNSKDEPFKTKQNLLDLLWIDGDDAIRSEQNPHLLLPVLNILDDLRNAHIVTIKKH